MTRSVKDLRELINISRLSFHGEEQEEALSDAPSQDDLEAGDTKDGEQQWWANEVKARQKSPLEERITNCSINSRLKPLPAIKTSPRRTPSYLQNLEKSCERVVENLDEEAVNSWLVRANGAVNVLSNWVCTENNFAKLAHFWLSEMKSVKQKELVELEVEIIMDELTFAVRNGLRENLLSREDVRMFFRAIVWEYPDKLCGKNSSIFLLSALLTLSSGRKAGYRKLLSNVRSWTKDPEHIHLILSARAFSLISVSLSIVKFSLSLAGNVLPETILVTDTRQDNLIRDLVFDAVKWGYTDVLQYFIKEHKYLDVFQLRNRQHLSVFFVAVMYGHKAMVEFFLKLKPEMHEVSPSGNGLLHVAVHSENVNVVKLLLASGVDINQVNVECDNTTPLHLAIIQDNSIMVSTLLNAGALFLHENYPKDSCSPLKLAQDLEMTEIVQMMTQLSNH